MIKMEVMFNFISEAGDFKKGQIIGTEDEKRARGWIEQGLVRVVKPQPTENKMAPGPSENKDADSGNSFGALTTGRLTDSQSSSAPGQDLLSSQSQAAPSSPPKSRRFARGAKEDAGGESQS